MSNLCRCGCGERLPENSRRTLKWGHFRNILNICKCGCGEACKTKYVKGHPKSSWNAGLTKETDQRVKHIGEKVAVSSGITFNSGRFQTGHIPHHLGKTKDNYEPLKIVSEKLTNHYLIGTRRVKFVNPGFYCKELGHFVRSKWEDRVAHLLISAKFEYNYEPKRFKLQNGKTYLPDFFIPALALYIEVGGVWRGKEKSWEKAEMFKALGYNIWFIDSKVYSFLTRLTRAQECTSLENIDKL